MNLNLDPSQKNLAFARACAGRKEHNWVVEALRQSLTSDCQAWQHFSMPRRQQIQARDLPTPGCVRLTESWAQTRCHLGVNVAAQMCVYLQSKLHRAHHHPVTQGAQSADTQSIVRCTCICRSTASRDLQSSRILEEMAAEHRSPREPNDHANSPRCWPIARELSTIAPELEAMKQNRPADGPNDEDGP